MAIDVLVGGIEKETDVVCLSTKAKIVEENMSVDEASGATSST